MVNEALQFILKTRVHAISTVVLGSLIAGLNWLAVSIISLVTLHKGEFEGGNLLGSMFLVGILYYFIEGSSHMIIQSLVLSALPIWILSVVLRRTASWTIVLETLTFLGILGTIVVYSFFPEWVYALINALQKNLFDAIVKMGVSNSELIIVKMSSIVNDFAIGGVGFFVLLNILLMVMMGRFFQARLCNPNGFKQEFSTLNIGWFSSALLLLALIGSFVDLTLAKAFLPIVFLPFIIVGISVIHCLANKHKYSKIILLFFYSALVLCAPAIIILLVVTAVLEKHFNFRALGNN